MKRIFRVLALLLGVIGVIACVGGAYGVWRVQVRLDRANHSIYDIVDNGLTAVQDRVPVVRERVRQSKITADDVSAAAKRWASAETRDRVVTSLEIESRTSTLSSHLQAADARLESSATSLQNLRQVLELTDVVGPVTQVAATGQAQETIATLRSKLQEAQTVVGDVQKFAADGGGPVENRFLQITEALARIALTLSDVDGRLDDFEKRLSEIRDEARERRDHRSGQIVRGAAVAWAVLLWIAVAMIALSSWGRKRG